MRLTRSNLLKPKSSTVFWHYHASSEHEFGYRHIEISFWEYLQVFYLNKEVNIIWDEKANKSIKWFLHDSSAVYINIINPLTPGVHKKVILKAAGLSIYDLLVDTRR